MKPVCPVKFQLPVIMIYNEHDYENSANEHDYKNSAVTVTFVLSYEDKALSLHSHTLLKSDVGNFVG